MRGEKKMKAILEMDIPKRCKDCFWYSNVTTEECERDGSDPTKADSIACSAFEEKPEKEEWWKINNESLEK